MLYNANACDILPKLWRVGAIVIDPPIKCVWRSGRAPLHATDFFQQARSIAGAMIVIMSEEAADNWPEPDQTIRWLWPPNESRIFVYGANCCYLPDAMLESWPDREAFGHGSCKPLPLLRRLVKGTAGTVLDCFMGTGTTGVACAEQGRAFIGVELDRAHYETAQRRIAEAGG